MFLRSLFEFLRACLNLRFLNVITFLRVTSAEKKTVLRFVQVRDTFLVAFFFLFRAVRKNLFHLRAIEEQSIGEHICYSNVAGDAKI